MWVNDTIEEDESLAGLLGGTCTCPSGTVYNVGHINGCSALACTGGVSNFGAGEGESECYGSGSRRRRRRRISVEEGDHIHVTCEPTGWTRWQTTEGSLSCSESVFGDPLPPSTPSSSRRRASGNVCQCRRTATTGAFLILPFHLPCASQYGLLPCVQITSSVAPSQRTHTGATTSQRRISSSSTRRAGPMTLTSPAIRSACR